MLRHAKAQDLILHPKVKKRLRSPPDITGVELEELLSWRAQKIEEAVRTGKGNAVIVEIYDIEDINEEASGGPKNS